MLRAQPRGAAGGAQGCQALGSDGAHSHQSVGRSVGLPWKGLACRELAAGAQGLRGPPSDLAWPLGLASTVLPSPGPANLPSMPSVTAPPGGIPGRIYGPASFMCHLFLFFFLFFMVKMRLSTPLLRVGAHYTGLWWGRGHVFT